MGPDDLRRNALGQLLAQLARRDAFHQLRTQQQLGYLVHMSPWTTLSVCSLVRSQHLFPSPLAVWLCRQECNMLPSRDVHAAAAVMVLGDTPMCSCSGPCCS